jgi:hypothetical protein
MPRHELNASNAPNTTTNTVAALLYQSATNQNNSVDSYRAQLSHHSQLNHSPGSSASHYTAANTSASNSNQQHSSSSSSHPTATYQTLSALNDANGASVSANNNSNTSSQGWQTNSGGGEASTPQQQFHQFSNRHIPLHYNSSAGYLIDPKSTSQQLYNLQRHDNSTTSTSNNEMVNGNVSSSHVTSVNSAKPGSSQSIRSRLNESGASNSGNGSAGSATSNDAHWSANSVKFGGFEYDLNNVPAHLRLGVDGKL